MSNEAISALTQLGGTMVGGFISAGVAFFTIRAGLGNQLELEARKFEYQQRLEAEKREHEGAAFRRKTLHTFRRLQNTAGMDEKARTSVPSWKFATRRVEMLLNSELCEKSLSDEQYHAAWRACDESGAAAMFLEMWAEDSEAERKEVVLLSLREYCDALKECFLTLGDQEHAEAVAAKMERDFRGVGFWMTDDHSRTVYPNPTR